MVNMGDRAFAEGNNSDKYSNCGQFDKKRLVKFAGSSVLRN
jgi:hypothetical protein